jgi:ATP-binding cassette subfamily C protein CydD
LSLAPPREIDRRATERFLRAAIVRRPLATAIVASLGVALCLVVLVAVLAVALERVVVDRAPLASIVPLLLGGAGAVFVRALLVDLAERQAAEAAAMSLASIRADVLARLFSDGNPFAASRPASAGASALLDGVDQLEPYYARYIPLVGRAVLVSVAYLAIVFPVNWVVGTLLLVATPFIPLNLVAVGLGAEAISRGQVEERHRLARVVLDRLQGLATLRRLGAAERELAAVAAATDTLRRKTVAVLRVAVLSSAVLEFFGTAMVAVAALYVGLALLGYVHLGVGAQGLSLESGLFLLLVAPAYVQPLRAAAAAYHDRADALAAAQDLLPAVATADIASGPADWTSARGACDDVEGPPTIELRGVTVAYPGRPRAALHAIGLTLPAGRIVGVAGPSGAGKSTLLGVIAGHVTPTLGTLLVDGRPLHVAAPGAWSARLAWMGQRPYLFPGSLADNIALGQPKASQRAIAAAAEQAGLGPLMAQRAGGLNTTVGERGAGLSGGEVRRVALARAFLKDAPLLLLDEPTASLDARTEEEVLAAIATLARGRTVVIASHSPRVLSLCDTVVLLDEGALLDVAHA